MNNKPVKNFTILHTELGASTPLPSAWTTCAFDKESALSAFRLNKPLDVVWSIVQLPTKAPRNLNNAPLK